MEVSRLEGYKSLRALNAFHTLMLGLKMLPAYGAIPYEEFFQTMSEMPDEDKKKLITEAALLVNLEKEEVEAMVCFCKDKNGVPYSAENMKSLSPAELVEVIVSVAFEITKFKIDFVTGAEKKN